MPIQNRVYLPRPYNHTHPLARGLAAWWLCVPGWMGGPRWFDLIGQYHGTLTSMGNVNNGWRSTTRQGGFGQMLFDGSAGFVNVPNGTPDISGTAITISAWVNIAGNAGGSSGSYHTVVRQPGTGATGNQYVFLLRSNRTFLLFEGGSIVAQSNTFSALNLNQWYNIVITYDGANVNFYVNAANVGTTVATTSLGTKNSAGAIGSSANGDYYLNGQMDDIHIYNRSLSSPEVFDLYRNSRLKYPGLLNQNVLSLSPIVIRFRKTLSSLGTRVGKRQIHYKPRGM